MVFIHPVILRDSSVASHYTNSKYNYMRALQIGEDADGVHLMPGKSHPVLPGMSEYTVSPDDQDAAPVQVPVPVQTDEPAAEEPGLDITDE